MDNEQYSSSRGDYIDDVDAVVLEKLMSQSVALARKPSQAWHFPKAVSLQGASASASVHS